MLILEIFKLAIAPAASRFRREPGPVRRWMFTSTLIEPRVIKPRFYTDLNYFRGRWLGDPCAGMRVRRVGPKATRTPSYPILGIDPGVSPHSSLNTHENSRLQIIGTSVI